MNIKKLLILGLILIAASTAISTISAEDGISSSSTSSSVTLVNNDLTINGIHFKVPEGFEEVEKDTNSDSDSEDDFLNDDADKKEDIDGTTVDSKVDSEFKNEAGEKLEVTVGSLANNKKIESISPSGFEQKTIAGKDGFFKKDNSDGKEYILFEYLENGQLVKIKAANEDVITQFIA